MLGINDPGDLKATQNLCKAVGGQMVPPVGNQQSEAFELWIKGNCLIFHSVQSHGSGKFYILEG